MSTFVDKPVCVFPAFRVSSSLYMSASVEISEGGTQYTGQVTERNYFLCFSASIQGTSYESLAGEIEYNLYNESGMSDLSFRYNQDLNRFVISSSEAWVGIWFNEPLAAALGFLPNVRYLAEAPDTITAPYPPQYAWQSTEHGFGMKTGEYQDREIMEQRFSDDGTPFSIRRAGIWNTEEVGFSYELKENVYSRYASGSRGYSWEHFINEAQRGKPFMVFHTGSTIISEHSGYDSAYLLSKEGSKFEPTKEDPYLDDYFKISFIGLVPPNVT